jgi:hypothetical protein
MIILAKSITIRAGKLEENRRLMEPTITQNSALYSARQRILERRFAFWRRPADRAGIKRTAERRRAFRSPEARIKP